MGRIRLLSEQVANQIAAGEVVERPVAVIKELVENSLDAGASRVLVTFRNGGRSLMRVEDNGHGMSADEAMLALERHATSKISEAADLHRVRTFGFRGEALPSIASVSHFTLRTRQEADEAGTEILVDAGRVRHQKVCGMAPGTTIEVAQLFKSVPARRKFLKTDKTEAAHIVQVMRLFALAHPQVAFSLEEKEREIMRSPACGELIERIAVAWNRSLAGELEPLLPYERDGVCLSGAFMKPGVGRTSRQDLQCFVNRRPVDSKTLTYALLEAYRGHLPRGRYPAVFLFVEIDPGSVDVNVHPAKREVRFRDEGGVRLAVLEALRRGLRQGQQGFATRGAAAEKSPEPARSGVGVPVEPRSPVGLPDTPVKAEAERLLQKHYAVQGKASSVSLSTAPQAVPQEPLKVRVLRWRYLGLLRKPRQIALFESEQGLVLLHCRAAHERVQYEALRERFAQEAEAAQPLLVPQLLELDAVSVAALEPHLEQLDKQGFRIMFFGRNVYRIEAFPAWLEPGRGVRFVKDLIEGLREGKITLESGKLAHEQLALLAARRAIRMDDQPGEAALIALAQQLLACKQPLSCPRGRPTLQEWSATQLAKKFGLSQEDSTVRYL